LEDVRLNQKKKRDSEGEYTTRSTEKKKQPTFDKEVREGGKAKGKEGQETTKIKGPMNLVSKKGVKRITTVGSENIERPGSLWGLGKDGFQRSTKRGKKNIYSTSTRQKMGKKRGQEEA